MSTPRPLWAMSPGIRRRIAVAQALPRPVAPVIQTASHAPSQKLPDALQQALAALNESPKP